MSIDRGLTYLDGGVEAWQGDGEVREFGGVEECCHALARAGEATLPGSLASLALHCRRHDLLSLWRTVAEEEKMSN